MVHVGTMGRYDPKGGIPWIFLMFADIKPKPNYLHIFVFLFCYKQSYGPNKDITKQYQI